MNTPSTKPMSQSLSNVHSAEPAKTFEKKESIQSRYDSIHDRIKDLAPWEEENAKPFHYRIRQDEGNFQDDRSEIYQCCCCSEEWSDNDVTTYWKPIRLQQYALGRDDAQSRMERTNNQDRWLCGTCVRKNQQQMEFQLIHAMALGNPLDKTMNRNDGKTRIMVKRIEEATDYRNRNESEIFGGEDND